MLAHTSSFVNTFLQIFTLPIFSRAAERVARFSEFYTPSVKNLLNFYRLSKKFEPKKSAQRFRFAVRKNFSLNIRRGTYSNLRLPVFCRTNVECRRRFFNFLPIIYMYPIRKAKILSPKSPLKIRFRASRRLYRRSHPFSVFISYFLLYARLDNWIPVKPMPSEQGLPFYKTAVPQNRKKGKPENFFDKSSYLYI